MKALKKSYWFYGHPKSPGRYEVGIADTRDAVLWYSEHGYEQISRTRAIRELRRRDYQGQAVFITVCINTFRVEEKPMLVAKALKNGLPLPRAAAEALITA